MQALCTEAHWWKQATFFTKALFFPASPGAVAPSLPRLERLTLHYQEKVHRQRHNFFMNAPALHSVEVQLHKAKKNNYSLPWEQISDLTLLYHSSISRAIHVLPSCNKLQKLEFSDPIMDFTGPCPIPTVLNRVESLAIATTASSYIFPLFIFPDIISLTLLKGACRRVYPGKDLISFLSLPCTPQLQYRIFENTHITDAHVLKILALTPLLHTLLNTPNTMKRRNLSCQENVFLPMMTVNLQIHFLQQQLGPNSVQKYKIIFEKFAFTCTVQTQCARWRHPDACLICLRSAASSRSI